MSNIAVTGRYTKALLAAADERGALDRVEGDARALMELIAGSEELGAFLDDPLVHPGTKQDLFGSLFADKVDGVTLSFLRLLCDKRRERSLPDILAHFLEALDERRGVVTARVKAASEMSSDQQDRLAQRLSEHSGKQVRLEVDVDRGLRAGFVARLGDVVFDGSLDAQLGRLRRTLMAG